MAVARSTAVVLGLSAAVSLTAAFLASRYSDQPWWPIALPAAALAIMAVATIVVSHVRERDALSPLGLTALFYLVSFAAGGIYFWAVHDPQLTGIAPVYDQGDVRRALILALVAFAAIVIGYVVNPLRPALRLLPKPPSWNSRSNSAPAGTSMSPARPRRRRRAPRGSSRRRPSFRRSPPRSSAPRRSWRGGAGRATCVRSSCSTCSSAPKSPGTCPPDPEARS
jgi:hypothetical protein